MIISTVLYYSFICCNFQRLQEDILRHLTDMIYAQPQKHKCLPITADIRISPEAVTKLHAVDYARCFFNSYFQLQPTRGI